MFRKILVFSLSVLVLTFIWGIHLVGASDQSDYVLDPALPRRVTGIGKVFEKANLFLRFGPESKTKYWRKLVDRRLMEVGMVVNQNRLDTFEETTSRYATYLGNYSGYLLDKELTNQKEITQKMFTKHLEILAPLRDKYEYDSAWWLLLQQDIDTVNIFKDKVWQTI